MIGRKYKKMLYWLLELQAIFILVFILCSLSESYYSNNHKNDIKIFSRVTGENPENPI